MTGGQPEESARETGMASGMASGTIRYWAAAKAAAGTAEEAFTADTLAEALRAARDRHAHRPDFARVLGRCSFLVNGEQVGSRPHEEVVLADGATVEVLPPFAGGSRGAVGEPG
jgi:molybdopterin synthase sulfur carrier subunit